MIKWQPAKGNTTARSVVYADTVEGRYAIIGNFYFTGGTTLYTVTHDTKVVQRNIRNFVEATRIAEAHMDVLRKGGKI